MSERPPPSPAQVALALAATGRVDAAHVLLEIALDEDPGDEECNEARDRLLQIDVHPLEPEETPRVYLGAPLVDAYVQGGLLREAQVIAQTLWSMTPDDPAAARRVKLFEQALAPLPDDAPAEIVQADGLLREGAVASALLAYREASQRPGAPAWARSRAEALRALVLAREAPTAAPSRVVSSTDDTTRVGRDPRRVLALLHERNLVGAADEARAAAGTMGGEMPVIAVALARLVEVANRVPRDSPESRSTLPMGRQGVADLHVRMANFDQAIALYRAVVESNPHDDDAREILGALRVVTRHMRTVSVDRVDSIAVKTPGDEVTRPALELAPTLSPLLQTGEIVLRTQRDPVIRAVERPEIDDDTDTSTEPASTVERTLRKSGGRLPEGDWSMASQSATLRDGEETAITSPEVAAELALRQGYPERALALYRELARGRPDEPRFALRIANIERTLGLVVDVPDAPTLAMDVIAEEPATTEAPSLFVAGRPVRSPTSPYRTQRRKPDAADGETPTDLPGLARPSIDPAHVGPPSPTVSPHLRRDTRADDGTRDAMPQLPDLVATVIATSSVVERARSPFDGLDEEETAVSVAASDAQREGLLVGPASPRRARVDADPLPMISTRVEELAPPTVRLPAVSEALARQMHPSRSRASTVESPAITAHEVASLPPPEPIAISRAEEPRARREVANLAGAPPPGDPDGAPETVRFSSMPDMNDSADARESMSDLDPNLPAVAKRRTIRVE